MIQGSFKNLLCLATITSTWKLLYVHLFLSNKLYFMYKAEILKIGTNQINHLKYVGKNILFLIKFHCENFKYSFFCFNIYAM